MKVVIQRTDEVKIIIDGKLHSASGKGLLLLAGFKNGDTAETIPYFIEKIINLRIFEDENGKMNLSVKDIGGEIAAVSQFTLYADTSRGRRPGFSDSAPPFISEPLYNEFINQLKNTGLKISEGIFGAHMLINLINNGPATFIIER